MKKLLEILAATSLVATTGVTSVVACNNSGQYNNPKGAFKLATSSFEMDAKNPREVGIENFNILDKSSYPTIQENVDDYKNFLAVNLDETAGVLVFTLIQDDFLGDLQVKLASQNGFTATINIKVVEAVVETEFTLASTNLTLQTNAIVKLRITNFNYLATENWPSTITFNKENLATASIDTATKEIIIRTNKDASTDLTMNVVSKNSNHSVLVQLKINQRTIDLENDNFVTNILAGNMNNQLIDPTIAIGKPQTVVSDESVLDSFNLMNNLNLSPQDVTIKQNGGTNGIGKIVTLAAQSNAKNIKGTMSLVLNQDVDVNDLFINKNIGDVKLTKGTFERLQEVMADPDGRTALASMIFENIGARNKIFEYLKTNVLTDPSAAFKILGGNMQISSYTINEFPSFCILTSTKPLVFNLRFSLEDRLSFRDAVKDITVTHKITKADYEAALTNRQAAQTAVKIIYQNLNEDFKKTVSLEHFTEYARFIDNEDFPGLSIIPGSNILYGHDAIAWFLMIKGSIEDFEDENFENSKYNFDGELGVYDLSKFIE
ncbi:hypothetical protein SCLARK_001763 [Spiroplasma clarkii]|uniref:Lipoprotein n=1 Tax=Spiroplasma clarkii TaxID=2139 RepID=A0A1Y0L2I9_9MOLU|nr:lipoprotein [Spiroplasma clarkii]ARU92216.1 hypothetical protein SCLARK_001763 [Spiroplasma clarkii]ATX71535.1 hypothetical protein SCLAR_v1c12350 [Spiroplasma clarkii]